jgi:hypothetical protein
MKRTESYFELCNPKVDDIVEDPYHAEAVP